MHDTHAQKIAGQLNLPIHKVAATIDLLTAGNTLPFIARYRKEATGGLDEEQIAAIMAAVGNAPGVGRTPRHSVLAAISEQDVCPNYRRRSSRRPRGPS